MENALIISLKFNYGHLSGLMGWYSMLNSLGYRTSFLMDEQYSGCFDEKNYDVLYRFSPQIGYYLVVFFNISAEDWKLARYLKEHTNAKILFIYHEPWRGLENEIKRFRHDSKNFIKQVGRMVFAREVIRSSDLVICPSAQAADFYRNHEARYNPHYVAFPLVFQDDCFGGKYRKDKTYFSFISTATLDKAVDCFFEFVKYVSSQDVHIQFQVVTSTDISAYLDAEIQQLIAVGRMVVRHGKGLSEAEMNEAYDNSKCTWLAYRSSTQSGVIAKAFMWGSPCIGTNVGVFGDLIDGTNGKIVSSCDAFEEILNAYYEIEANQQHYERSARQTFERVYSAKQRTNQLADLIDALYQRG